MKVRTEDDVKKELEETRLKLERFEEKYKDILSEHNELTRRVGYLKGSIEYETWREGHYYKVFYERDDTWFYIFIKKVYAQKFVCSMGRICGEKCEEPHWKTGFSTDAEYAYFRNHKLIEISKEEYEKVCKKLDGWTEEYY